MRVSMCHCLACQRRTGSAFGVQARFLRDRVRVEGRSTRVHAHLGRGRPADVPFLPRVRRDGLLLPPGEDDVVAIPVGAFADPTFPAPVRSVYESRRHEWVAVPAAERWD